MNRMWQPDGAVGLCIDAKVSGNRPREVERDAKIVLRIEVLVFIYEARVARFVLMTSGAGRGSVTESMSSLDICCLLICISIAGVRVSELHCRVHSYLEFPCRQLPLFLSLYTRNISS